MNDVSLDRMRATLRRSRRSVLAFISASLVTTPALDARKKRGRRQKVRKNTYGCVNVGNFCKRDDQCCSGICTGKKGKKRCRDHDASTCQPTQDICYDETATCTTTAGLKGECLITIGGASFCGSIGLCTDCARDADCIPKFGPDAACVVCVKGCGPHTTRGTSCVVPGKLVL
jgi:hypothetical protein